MGTMLIHSNHHSNVLSTIFFCVFKGLTITVNYLAINLGFAPKFDIYQKSRNKLHLRNSSTKSIVVQKQKHYYHLTPRRFLEINCTMTKQQLIVKTWKSCSVCPYSRFTISKLKRIIYIIILNYRIILFCMEFVEEQLAFWAPIGKYQKYNEFETTGKYILKF